VRNHRDLPSTDFRNLFPSREGIAGELKKDAGRKKTLAS
jgi:hypothetical protein